MQDYLQIYEDDAHWLLFARRNRCRSDSIPHQYRPYRQLVHVSPTVLGQDNVKRSIRLHDGQRGHA